MLLLSGIRKSYGTVEALRGVSLEVRPGEILGLLGPNGAGKTTLVSITCGLVRPDAGSVEVGGIDVLKHARRASPLIGLAPQELAIYPILSVRENMVFFGELNGLRGSELKRRISDIAEILQLAQLLDRPARTLSGGEKRRLHTALALIHRPRLLLLDEPTAGVDVSTRADLIDAVRRLAQEGSTVCYSTHYLTEVELLEASVAILDRGVLVAHDALHDLIAQHGTAGIELTFEGSAPRIKLDAPVERLGSRLRISVSDPASAIARILPSLGARLKRLRSVEVFTPSLESVFMALTGRRYEAEDEPSVAAP